MAMRLDKFLTELGICSRSEAKRLVNSKQITVNNQIVDRPERKIDETVDVICLRGQQLHYAALEYYLLNKPAGCVTATEDAVHKTVMDCLAGVSRRGLFPVGRLDIDTEGLLLITNDGELAHALLSPKTHVPKTYYAKVRGIVTEEHVNLFEKGVDIGEKALTRPGKLEILRAGQMKPQGASDCRAPVDAGGCLPVAGVCSEILLTITEGKFHQVKRMFSAVGREVLYLKRLSMGALMLPEDLLPGEYRALTEEERQRLWHWR